MKPLLILLGLSLAANAALYFTRPANSSKTASAAPASPSASGATTEKTSTSQTNNTSAAAHPHAAFWAKLPPGDPALAEKLRAAGWPEDAIRALVTAYVQDLFRPRERALQSDSTSGEYWRQSYFGNRSPAAYKTWRDLQREKLTLMKTILGADYIPEPSQDVRFAGLNPAVAESVAMIEQDYSVLTAEVRGDRTFGTTLLLPEDREKLAFLEKEKAADLAKVLSPEQLLDYELKNSSTASSLRYSLAAFNPTEQEFREIYALQKTLTERLGPLSAGMSVSQREDRNAAQAEIDAQVKQRLSPERYEDYTRAKDFDYRALYQIADKLQLRPENALAAYEVKADIEKRAREIQPTSGPDARAALVQEAEKRLVEALGQHGYEAYKLNGAFWLRNLNPPARPSTPRP
jgi:hypothetical protein